MFKISLNKVDRLIKKSQGITEDPIKIAIKSALRSNCTIIIKKGNDEWSGSGFHIGNGYIGTVEHVAQYKLLKEEYKMTVTFDGQNHHETRMIVGSPENDVAIVHCEHATQLPHVELGDSNKIEVGDIVAVIGSPEGWHDTATVGRITNKNQNLGEYAPSPAWNDMMFVDADISEGSSGGMVIATDGKVYAIIMGLTGYHANIGIGQNAVIPINKLKQILDTLSFKK